MSDVSRKELSKIPYLDQKILGDRVILSSMFYDNNEWHWWIPTPKGLIKAQGFPAESSYFSKLPERQNDIYLHFINFIAQRASWPEIVKPFNGLLDDIYNLSASLRKFKILYEYSKKDSEGVSRLVVTEIEYLFSVCRSVFDLLQEIISILWNNFHFFDSEIKLKPLPKEFRKVIFHAGELSTENQIIKKFGMPDLLAKFYIRHQAFFSTLRKFRDNIIHYGSTFKLIFVTERGFAVSNDLKPFCEFNVWNDEHKLENHLCSLRPALAHLINQTLLACEDFSRTIETIIKFPPPLVPGMKFFMRGYLNDELFQNYLALKECHWWDTK